MKNIFVGNLDFAATESSVRSLFEPYGQVDRVNVVTDRETGRSRGFAFVEMADGAEAERAIAALNGIQLDGRALNINEARPKPAGGGGGGRGFGGGGGGWWTRSAPRAPLVRARHKQEARRPALRVAPPKYRSLSYGYSFAHIISKTAEGNRPHGEAAR